MKPFAQIARPFGISRFASLEAACASVGQGGHFAVAGRSPTPPPLLDVADVGLLSLPLGSDQLEALKRRATGAPCGRGAATLLDEAVRPTWRVSPEAVTAREAAWEGAGLPGLVSEAALGLGESGEVAAHLHGLLVHGPRDACVPLGDSERVPWMFGTLMVALPSAHEGGALVVSHRGERFVAQRDDVSLTAVSWAAFHSDCAHELEPVRTGHRVVLVHDLVRHDAPPAPCPGRARDEATRALRDLERGHADRAPSQVIRVLEQRDTSEALSWEDLKGREAAIATPSRAV